MSDDLELLKGSIDIIEEWEEEQWRENHGNDDDEE